MIPVLMLARGRKDALDKLMSMANGVSSPELVEGSRGRGARCGHVYLAWGFAPSPLAFKIAENVLGLYRPTCSQDLCCPAGPEGPAKLPKARPPVSRRLFYTCYAGTHASVVAACLHLGLMGANCDQASPEQAAAGSGICDLPGFDRRGSAEIGVPLRIGVDPWGTEVYALGTGWLSRPIELALCDLIEVASPESFACMCSVRGFLDSRSRMGGFLSRRCRLVNPGRRIIGSSLARRVPLMKVAVDACLDLSLRWKDNEKQRKGEVIWVDGRAALPANSRDCTGG